MTLMAAETFRHSPEAEAHRRAKARDLAMSLRRAGHTLKDRPIVDSFRREFERLAGVRRCSDLTWELVWQLVDDEEPPL